MNSRRRLELLKPATNGVRHKIWGVTHREVISFRNDDLSRSRKQFLPVLLKAKRIVALAKYGEQRYRGQWPGEHSRHTCIHIVAVKGVTHIVVEGAEAPWAHPGAKRRAARPIQVAADTEGRRSDARNQTGQDIKLAHDRTSDNREHASQRRAGGPPPETVHCHNPPHTCGHSRQRSKSRRPTEVMCDECEFL